jgi:hypothetical protein
MPTNTYTPLATVTLGGTDSEILFSSIPATYRDLILIAQIRSQAGGTGDVARLQLNSDTGSNYPRVGMYGTGSSAGSFSGTDPGFILQTSASGSTAGVFDYNVVQIMDYSATDKHKTALLRQSEATGTTVLAQAARWSNTAAVTSLRITTDGGDAFSVGSTFSLYGVIA